MELKYLHVNSEKKRIEEAIELMEANLKLVLVLNN